MNERTLAVQIVESLRKGIPPHRGVELYSVGNEKLMNGVRKQHLNGIRDCGLIRFVSGSWGAGKTHLFRQLREAAFEAGCLVSTVELDTTSAALNKFQTVFASIIRQVATPSFYSGQTKSEAAPFGIVLEEALIWLGTGSRERIDEITGEHVAVASTSLMRDHSIDIDFKKMIQHYWETYVSESADVALIEQTRGEILQWFAGEGTVGSFRKRFGVSKLVAKENAKLMLQSLSGFVRLAGYEGLLILFDEAEQSYSVLRKAALKEAHNNLLSLINNIEALPGLFLIYATTPDFYNDPKHGIRTYGALAGRIGSPEDRPPRALDTIWNLDAVETGLDDYKVAAKKVREIYSKAYPDLSNELPSDDSLDSLVEHLHGQHSNFASVRFWRLLVSALITAFDDIAEGESRSPEKLYDDVMDRLRED